jgi:hypothetical protein
MPHSGDVISPSSPAPSSGHRVPDIALPIGSQGTVQWARAKALNHPYSSTLASKVFSSQPSTSIFVKWEWR